MVHKPVLLNEVISELDPKEGETFVDGTLNVGGHAKEIAMLLGKSGHLVGIDQDETALALAKKNLADVPCQVDLLNGNFKDIPELLATIKVEEVDAVLLDIGLSSDQLELSGRGFTFQKDEPLLMTFKAKPTEEDLTAREIINDWDEENIEAILSGYGEETFAKRIAKAIMTARKDHPIETTFQLVEVIKSAVPTGYTKRRIHFATKTFQALRITVNDEIGSLKKAMENIWPILKIGGRLGIISFHSLEARTIKNFYKQKVSSEEGVLTKKKAIQASREEEKENPRSRSAQLRVIKKIA